MSVTGSRTRRNRYWCPPKPWVRTKPVRSMFRPEDLEDLREISETWGLPVATVVWVIVVNQLARWRRQAPDLGQYGLAIAAGVAVTRYATNHPPKPSE